MICKIHEISTARYGVFLEKNPRNLTSCHGFWGPKVYPDRLHIGVDPEWAFECELVQDGSSNIFLITNIILPQPYNPFGSRKVTLVQRQKMREMSQV